MTPTDAGYDPANAVASASHETMIDVGDVAVRLLVEWRRWLVWTLIFFAVGAVFIWRIPPLYVAHAVLLPKDKTKVDSVAALTGRQEGSSYVGLLLSRTVLDSVVDRDHLMEVYHVPSREIARGILFNHSIIFSAEDGMVRIDIRDRDAKTAAAIANAYVDGLEELQQKATLHEAELRSRFYEQQVAQETDALTAAEQDLQGEQQKTGVIEPSAQTEIGLNNIATLGNQITALQVQLSSLLLAESESNPEVQQLRARIGTLEAKQRAMETSNAGTVVGNSPAAAKMPEVNIEYARKQREVKYHETLLNSLASQYELARIGENFTGAEFEIVDRAAVPEFQSRPYGNILLPIDAVASALLGLFAVVFTLVWRHLMADPLQRARVEIVKSSFRFRR